MEFFQGPGRTEPSSRLGALQGEVTSHLNCLANAVAVDEPDLYSDYVAWAHSTLHARGVPDEYLPSILSILLRCMPDVLPNGHDGRAVDFVRAAIAQLETHIEEHTYIDARGPFAGLAKEYLDELMAGDFDAAEAMIFRALGLGMRVQEIYVHVLQPAQWELGRAWQSNEISVVKEHYCTACTRSIMAQLSSTLAARDRAGRRVVAVCVNDELHDLGLAMVCDFLRMEGWQTYFVGANVPSDEIIRPLTEQTTPVLAISATMVAHLRWVAAVVDLVRSCPQCQEVAIMVGGRPFRIARDLWHKLGADGWAADAEEAVTTAERLVSMVPTSS